MIFRHQHWHKVAAVSTRTAAFSGTRVTEILWRCPCGHVTTQELAGAWTLAQIRGEPEPAPVERLLEAGLPTGRERSA